MDVALALSNLVSEARYIGSLTANTQEAYNALYWGDSRPKPTWDAIVAQAAIDDLILAKKEKDKELDKSLWIEICKNVVVNVDGVDIAMQCSCASYKKLLAEINRMNLSGETTTTIMDANNNVHDNIAKADFEGAVNVVATRYTALRNKYWEFKESLANATDIATVNALTFDYTGV